MSNQAGLREINKRYKAYRQRQIARAEKATSYAAFLERYTATIVRDVATTGRTVI